MTKRRASKQDRERDVLLGLVDLYIRHGKPVGSQTLQEEGFEHLSSATIRNYFAKLEMEGFLRQHHTSGGRSPTDKAFRLYAEEAEARPSPHKPVLLPHETKTIPIYLEGVVHALSDLSNCVTLLTAPRFDQDFILTIRLMPLDEGRVLCALLTDFGQVHTEVLHTQFDVKRLEAYFHYRLTNQTKPPLSQEEEALAKQHYNEIVLRHFVNYTNMHTEEIYKAGFSKLLHYPEFHDPAILSSTLALFENTPVIRSLLHEAFDDLQIWIGDDLPAPHYASLIAIPYYIAQKPVGVIALLGPDRMPYRELISLLRSASRTLSENLTKSLYKFKLDYRQPKSKEVGTKSKPLGVTHEKDDGNGRTTS